MKAFTMSGSLKFPGAAALIAFSSMLSADEPPIRFLVLAGHTEALTDGSFSPDGTLVVTASRDKTARIWDSVTGKELFTLNGHDGSVVSVAFSPDGRLVLTGSKDKTARIWDSSNGKELHPVEGPRRQFDVLDLLEPRWKASLATSCDDPARIWDAISGKELFSINGHGSVILSIAFSPDDTRILTTEDQWIYFWDATKGKELHKIRRQGGDPLLISTIDWAVFSPDGNRLVIPEGKGAYILEATTGKVLRALGGHKTHVSSAVFSPNGKNLVTASDVTLVMVSSSGKPIKSQDFTIHVWDSASGKEIFQVNEYKDSIGSTGFSPDGEQLLTCGDSRADLWDAKTGGKIIGLTGHAGSVGAAVFSTDGKRAATVSQDKTARIWTLPSGK